MITIPIIYSYPNNSLYNNQNYNIYMHFSLITTPHISQKKQTNHKERKIQSQP